MIFSGKRPVRRAAAAAAFVVLGLLPLWGESTGAVTGSLGSGTVVADTSVVTRLMERILERAGSLKAASSRAAEAYHEFREAAAERLPSVSLVNGETSFVDGTGYRYSMSRERDDERHFMSGGILVTQETFAGGSIEAQGYGTYELGRENTELIPRVSFAVRQPLFVNGKIVEPELRGTSRKSAEISYRMAEQNETNVRNEIVLLGVEELLTMTVRVRNACYQRELVETLTEQLRQERLLLEQKSITVSDLRETEIEMLDARGKLLQEEQAVHLASTTLEGRLGEPLDPYLDEITALDVPDTALPAREALLADALETNPDIELDRLSLARTRSEGVAEQLRYAANLALGVSLSASDLDRLSTGPELDLAVELRIPLYTGGARTASRLASEARTEAAELDLRETQRETRDRIDAGYLSDAFLAEQVSFYEESREYASTRARETRRLLELGLATALDVRKAELEVRRQDGLLREKRVERFLNALEILSREGRALDRELPRLLGS